MLACAASDPTIKKGTWAVQIIEDCAMWSFPQELEQLINKHVTMLNTQR